MRTNANDRADIFFLQSTNGGANWSTGAVVRVNTDSTTNDQWMPTIAVKPDGNQLFLGWLDRRGDTNNSSIDVYGRWATIGTNGSVTFTNDFRITTESFPPAFAGTLPQNKAEGHYDPVWPPGGVPLGWWYSEWWGTNWLGEADTTYSTYANEAGEHLGACATTTHVYFVWSDNRNGSQATKYAARKQGDVRLARVPWPQL
jgi:hypothetical protein